MIRREKRQYKRVAVSLEAELRPINSSPLASTEQGAKLIAKVTNLSPIGLSVKLADTYRIGSRFLVRLELDSRMIAFFASVRRVYPTTEFAAAMHGHGLQIIAADEETIHAIMRYVAGRGGGVLPPAAPPPPAQSSGSR
ncbi:MAG TPA: PilZ domain-containing protein [Capsulimonadaceae bacterium]|nr:PilZ domain-containing protein [Capsulimonadaceae bacterium]